MRNHDPIWWNGAIVPWDAAQVHVTSETSLRGLNVFEGIRAYWRPKQRCYAVVALDAHLDRLEHSASLIHITPADLRARLYQGIFDLLLAISCPDNLYLRPTIYVESGAYETDPRRIIVGAFISWRRVKARTYNAIRCTISSWRHIPPASLPSAAKIGASYTAFRLARLEAASKGFDEAILLNEHGEVTETPGGSVFALKGGTFLTPPLHAGILPSITRRIVLETLCPELGFPSEECPLSPLDLRTADAAMIAGTLNEISHMTLIDDHEFSANRSAYTPIEDLAHLYRLLCDEAPERTSPWISLIPSEAEWK